MVHACVALQPGTHAFVLVLQMVPSGQSLSIVQPTHWCVVVWQTSGAPVSAVPPSAAATQSAFVLQPASHLSLASQKCPCGQVSFDATHSTHCPLATSQTLPVGE